MYAMQSAAACHGRTRASERSQRHSLSARICSFRCPAAQVVPDVAMPTEPPTAQLRWRLCEYSQAVLLLSLTWASSETSALLPDPLQIGRKEIGARSLVLSPYQQIRNHVGLLRRPAAAPLFFVGGGHHPGGEVGPQPAERLRLPRPPAVLHPRQPRDVRVTAEDEVGQLRPARLVVATPSPT